MPGDAHALNHIAWSEISQAKWDMRRMLGDFTRGIPSSVFTICDFVHPGFGIANYGLLRADSARNVIGVKRAFAAVRNVVTVFDSEVSRVGRRVSSPETSLQLWEFERRGAPLFVFWTAGEWEFADGGWRMAYRRPGDSLETRPAVLNWPGTPFADPVWMAVWRESTRGTGRREPRILEAVEMIRREACDGLSAEELAARFPGTRRLFELRFREAMGHSSGENLFRKSSAIADENRRARPRCRARRKLISNRPRSVFDWRTK